MKPLEPLGYAILLFIGSLYLYKEEEIFFIVPYLFSILAISYLLSKEYGIEEGEDEEI